jgi:hypothetical protein
MIMFPFGIIKPFAIAISVKFAPKIILLRFKNSHPKLDLTHPPKLITAISILKFLPANNYCYDRKVSESRKSFLYGYKPCMILKILPE